MWRVQDDQLFGHLGVVDGELPGQHTAPVVAHDDCALLAQAVDQARDIAQQRGDVVATFGLLRVVVATQIGCDHAIAMLRQYGDLEAPGVPEFGEAVQQHDERPLALCDIVHADAVGDNFAMLPSFCDGLCHMLDLLLANIRAIVQHCHPTPSRPL